MRVGLPHFGQSVLLVVSMTFLRSAVFVIFAIALSWDDSSGQASPASSLSRSIQEATRVGVSRETQPSRDAHVSSSRPPRRTASTAGGRPYRVPDERRFRVRQVKAPLSLRRIACLFYLSCQSSAPVASPAKQTALKSVQTIGKTVPESATYLYGTNSVSLQTQSHCGESAFAAKCHLSAGITGHQSFSAGRSLRIAVCNPVSKSTNVSAGQSFCWSPRMTQPCQRSRQVRAGRRTVAPAAWPNAILAHLSLAL